MKYSVEIIEGEIFHIYVHEKKERELLLEAKVKGTPLTGTYSVKKHSPHGPTGEYHLHVYDGSNEIFSINKSGSGHDGYSGTRIPNKVFTALKSKYPGWDFPASQIIESLDHVVAFDFRLQFLRPIRVASYKDDSLSEMYGFDGFFHGFAASPFLTGGGYHDKTFAIVEDESGYVRKVPIEKLKFLDINND